MKKGVEKVQKWIIIGALLLGIAICAAGLIYKGLSGPTGDITPAAGNQVKNTESATPLPPDINTNLYSKLRYGKPVNIVIFGDETVRSEGELTSEKKWDHQLKKLLETNYKSQVTISTFTTYKGTSWSSLMSLNKYLQHKSPRPDLIVFCFGVNDQRELSLDQFKTIYEAALQTVGQGYPDTETLLVQQPNLAQEYVEAFTLLSSHYGLNIIDASGVAEADYHPYAQKTFELLKDKTDSFSKPISLTKVQPLNNVNKYLYWQRIEEHGQSHLMETASVNDGFPRLLSNKNGAFVESTFQGTSVGAIIKCVPDGGMARLYIDGKKYGLIDTYAPESMMRYVLIADDLQPGEHKVKLIVLNQKKEPSTGTRVIWYGFDSTGE